MSQMMDGSATSKHHIPTRFYKCQVCGGVIYQSRISGGVPYDPDRTDHLVHMDVEDWQDNVHQAVIAS